MFEHRAVIVGTTPASVSGEIIELSFSYFLLFTEIVVINPASRLASDRIRYISFFFRIEVVAMTLVLIDTLEILQNLFRKVIFLIHVLFEYILNAIFKRVWLWEFERLSVSISANGNAEYPFPMLRYAIVSCVHNMIIAVISEIVKLVHPSHEEGLKLLLQQRFHILHHKVLRTFDLDGLPALP